VELIIVVTIIGILALLAVPALLKAQRNAVSSQFINDLRIICGAVELYTIEHGSYPPDGMAGLPPQLQPYLRSKLNTERSPLGGVWDWDTNQFGVTAGISVFKPIADDRLLTEIDARIDDGDLTTGSFRKRTSGVIYVIQP
jgi:type IV pilus assembly protein PilA